MALQARLARKDRTALDEVQRQWLTLLDPVEPCRLALEALIWEKRVLASDVWERIRRQFEANRASWARQTMMYLPASQTPEEKQMISALFKTFFQSINSKNDDRATDQVENVMSSFLGKTNAHKEDVASFIHKIWKNDITNMNWRINNDYTIKKQSVGDDKYEYQVQFSARQSVSSTDSSQPTQSDFRINATVSPNGKFGSFNMAKVIL